MSCSCPSIVTFFNGTFQNCNSLKTVVIVGMNNVLTNPPFTGCGSLTHLYIPDTLTVTNANFLLNCYALKSVRNSQTFTSLANSTYQGCRSLTELEFSDTLTTIGVNVFNGCVSILEYTFLSTTPPTLGNINSFTGINPACKIYVPDASVAAYKIATNWASFSSYIYPLSTKP